VGDDRISVEVVERGAVGADRDAADACVGGQSARAARRAGGRDDDLDPGRANRGDGGAGAVGDGAVRAQQGAVEIDRDQLNPTRPKTTPRSTFGDKLAQATAYKKSLLLAAGLSGRGADELLAGATITSATDRATVRGFQQRNRRPSGGLTNFEIQALMSQYNQAETLASSVQKKQDDANNGVIGKISDIAYPA
jgi:hypothetical protein